MKKILPILAALLAAALLAGCGPTPASGGASGAEEADFSWHMAWANWSGEGQLLEGCENGAKMAISSVRHLPIWKVDSVEALERFKETPGQYLTLDQGWDEAPSFLKATEGCDEAFFAQKALLLIYLEASSSSFRFGVREIAVQDGSLCVHVEQTNRPEVFDTMMAGWLVVVEAPLARLEGVTGFDADLDHF